MKLARQEIRDVVPCVHGGNIWKVAEKYNVDARKILDFSSNLSPLGPSKKVIKAIHENLWKIPYYPDPECTELRRAISNYVGGEVKTENILVGNGSTELIYLFCETFINKNDLALIPTPTWGEYENAVKKVGGKPVYLGCGIDFKMDKGKFLQKINSKVKAIFLCNPNNPTGILMPKDDVLKILEKAASENVLAFVDEAFVEFLDEERSYSMAKEVKNYQNLFVLRSLTKAFGLAGLRVGYGIACEDMIKVLSKGKMPWNVNCLAQVAAISAIEDHEHLTAVRKLINEERKFLLSELSKIRGLKVFPTDANFILMDIRQFGLTAAQLKDKMLSHGILVRDCSSFRGLDEYYVRVSIRTRQENEKLLANLKEALGACC